MLSYQCLFILLILVSQSLQQSIQNGYCYAPPIIPSFNISQFAGTWYQIQRVPNSVEQHDCTVLQITVSSSSNPSQSNGTYTMTEIAINNNRVTWTGPFSANAFGNFLLTTSLGTYSVVSTDYTGYALVHHCRNNIGSNTKSGTVYCWLVSGWKWSRTRTLSASHNAAINTAINATLELRNVTWRNTAQTCSGSERMLASITLLFVAIFFSIKS